jgi:c-di-GMP-binding flagellar brake protein YcgR
MTPGPEVRLTRRVRVRLVDISLGGALVASDERLPPGTAGELRVPLGGEPFKASVEIRREEPPLAAPVMLGTAILDVNRGSRETLEQFLRKWQ